MTLQSKVYCSVAYATDKCLGSEERKTFQILQCYLSEVVILRDTNLFKMSFIRKEIKEARVNFNSLTK